MSKTGALIKNTFNSLFKKVENISSEKEENELINQALEFQSKGAYDEAIKCFNKALKINPMNHRVITLRAMAKTLNEDKAGAIRDLITVVTIDPNDGFAWHGLAENYFELKEYDLSKKACDKVIELDMANHYVYYMRGCINYFNKEYKDAYDDFNVSIQKENRWVGNYYYLGLACHKLGLLDEELDNYNKGILLGSQDHMIYYNRGAIKLEKKEFDSAKEDFITAAGKGSKDAERVLDNWEKHKKG
jgi:tetratricopeptide (TPR) repeat protein